MAAVKNRFWTPLIRREGRFLPEFGSFVRGEAIAKMSELRRKGARRIDLKIIASDPERLSHQIPTWLRSQRTLKR
jgi:hypothetical protein